MSSEFQNGLRTYLVDLFKACSSQNSPIFHNQYPIKSIFNPSKTVRPALYLSVDNLKFVIAVYDPKKDKKITRMHLDPIFSYIWNKQAEIGVILILGENSDKISYSSGHQGAQALIQKFPTIWQRITKFSLNETEKRLIERYRFIRDNKIEYRTRIGEIDRIILGLFEKISTFFTIVQTSQGPLVFDAKRSYILEHLKRVKEYSLPNINLVYEHLQCILQIIDDSSLQDLFTSLAAYNQIGEVNPDFFNIQANALSNLATCVENFAKNMYRKTYIFAPIQNIQPLTTLKSCYFTRARSQVRTNYPSLERQGFIRQVDSENLISIFANETWFSEFIYVIKNYGFFISGDSEDICSKLELIIHNDFSNDSNFFNEFKRSETNVFIQKLTIALLVRNWLAHEPNKECILRFRHFIEDYYDSLLSVILIFYRQAQDKLDPNLIF